MSKSLCDLSNCRAFRKFFSVSYKTHTCMCTLIWTNRNCPLYPLVIGSRSGIYCSSIGCFLEVLLTQMSHNPRSKSITEDIDHRPEPITENEMEKNYLHVAPASLIRPSDVLYVIFVGLTGPNRWPQSARCQQAVTPQRSGQSPW